MLAWTENILQAGLMELMALRDNHDFLQFFSFHIYILQFCVFILFLCINSCYLLIIFIVIFFGLYGKSNKKKKEIK